MTDRDWRVADALDRLLPLSVEPEDWTRVLRDAQRASRRRRALSAAVAAALVITVGAALAATGLPWWESTGPPVNPAVVERQLVPSGSFPPSADRARARTVARAEGAALVAAPVGKSGYCLIPSLAGSPDIGFSCIYQVEGDAGSGSEFRSFARPPSAGEPRWIVYGRVTDAEAAVLDLSPAAGTPLRLRLSEGGFFLTNVPRQRWAALADKAGEAHILDADGATLRTVCIDWGPSPESDGAGRTRYASPIDGPKPAGQCEARPLVFPTPVLRKAELKLEVPAAEGQVLRFYTAPSTTGGECTFTVVAAPGSPVEPERMGGGACTASAVDGAAARAPITIGVSKVKKGLSAVFSEVSGTVAPALGARRVMLEWATGSHELAFDGTYFLGANLFYNPPEQALPYSVVAYGADGQEVARLAIPKSWLYIE